MSPPFEIIRGQSRQTPLDPVVSEFAQRYRLIPRPRQRHPALAATQDQYAQRGRQQLQHTTRSQDLGLLPSAVEATLTRARAGHPGIYTVALHLLAAQLTSTDNEAQRRQARAQAQSIAQEALHDITLAALPTREKVKKLFEVALTLAAIFARPDGAAQTREEREALHEIFVQINALITQNNIERTVDPQIRSTPNFWSSFARAQQALLAENSTEALAGLLETRRSLNALSGQARPGSLRAQIEAATHWGLEAFPRDDVAQEAENLRTMVTLEALSNFYQVDFLENHSEDEAPQAQSQVQSFQLIANLFSRRGTGLTAASLLRRLQHLPAQDGEWLTGTLEALRRQPDFHRTLREWHLDNLSIEEIRDRLLQDSQQVAQHLQEHRNETPYRTVLDRDGEGRHIRWLAEFLRGQTQLRSTLAGQLGLGGGADPYTVVRSLLELGPQAEALIPLQPNLRLFSQHLHEALDANEGLENSLQELLSSMISLARDEDHYGPAYLAFFQSLHRTRNLADGFELPALLRSQAGGAAQDLQNFSTRRVFRHLTHPSSLGMMALGIVLAEFAPIALLRGAGEAGELGGLVRGGALTLRGEMLVGVGVGIGMWAGGLIPHLLTTRRNRWEEFTRSLPGLAVSSLALALTAVAAHGLRSRLLPGGTAPSFGRMAALRLTNIGVGGGLMLGGGAVTRGLVTGEWAPPTSEETAEMFLTMAAWDLGSAGLRAVGNRWWWRHQLGPARAHQVEVRVRDILRLNPDLQASEGFIRNYLGFRMASNRGIQDISDSVEGNLIPYLEGMGNRRQLRFAPGEQAVGDTSSSQRLRAAEIIMGVEDAGQREQFDQVLTSESFHEFRREMENIRAELRRRMDADERNPVVFVRIRLVGSEIEMETLEGIPRDTRHALRVRLNGFTNHDVMTNLEDPVLRAVLKYYQVRFFGGPVLSTPAGAEVGRSQGEAERTAGHRPPVSQPPSPTAAEVPVPPPPAAVPEAEPAPPPPPVGAGLAPPAPPAPTRPHQPAQELLDAAQPTAPRAPVLEIAADGTPAEVVPTSRPRGDDTKRITADTLTQALQRAAAPEGPPPPAETRPEETAEPIPLTQQRPPADETDFSDVTSDAPPTALPDEIVGAGLALPGAEERRATEEVPNEAIVGERDDSGPYLEVDTSDLILEDPPPMLDAITVRPPPLPSAREQPTPLPPTGSDLSPTSDLFQKLAGRAQGLRSPLVDGPQTEGLPVREVANYERMTQNFMDLIEALHRSYRENPASLYFIEVNPEGQMTLIRPEQMYRHHEDHGYFQLGLHRKAPGPCFVIVSDPFITLDLEQLSFSHYLHQMFQ